MWNEVDEVEKNNAKTRYQGINTAKNTLKSIEYIYGLKNVDLFRSTVFCHTMKVEVRPLFFNFVTEFFQQHGGYNDG